MAEVTVTAVAVPKKLFWVRIVQKDVTGSIEKVLLGKDIIATTGESAKALAIAEASSKNPDADFSRIAVGCGEVALT